MVAMKMLVLEERNDLRERGIQVRRPKINLHHIAVRFVVVAVVHDEPGRPLSEKVGNLIAQVQIGVVQLLRIQPEHHRWHLAPFVRPTIPRFSGGQASERRDRADRPPAIPGSSCRPPRSSFDGVTVLLQKVAATDASVRSQRRVGRLHRRDWRWSSHSRRSNPYQASSIASPRSKLFDLRTPLRFMPIFSRTRAEARLWASTIDL